MINVLIIKILMPKDFLLENSTVVIRISIHRFCSDCTHAYGMCNMGSVFAFRESRLQFITNMHMHINFLNLFYVKCQLVSYLFFIYC